MGGVLQIFFSAGDAALSPSPSPAAAAEGGSSGAAWCRAFVAGVEGVEFYGGAKAGMRTVLDAVVPAAEALRKNGPSGMWVVLAAVGVWVWLFYPRLCRFCFHIIVETWGTFWYRERKQARKKAFF